MISEQLRLKQNHKNYYRNGLRKMLNLLFLALLTILILLGLCLYHYFTMSEPYYYATSSDGSLTQLLSVPKGTGLVERNQG